MNDEPEIITIDTADAELNRIDRVVVRYDAYTREVNTTVIKGSPALSPTPPARLETPEQFDLVLADIYVPAAATVINSSNITDMRDSELCGYIGVKGAVSQLQFDAHLSENSGKHITESGENANGNYIRFDDGTQICWAEHEENITTTVYDGTNYSVLNYHFWPAPFSATYPPVGAITGNKSEIIGIAQYSWGNSSYTGAIYTRVPFSNKATKIRAFAIGRWK